MTHPANRHWPYASPLKEIEESISTISKTKNEQLLELRKKLNNLTTLVKGAIGLEILKSTSIKDNLQEVKDKETEPHKSESS